MSDEMNEQDQATETVEPPRAYRELKRAQEATEDAMRGALWTAIHNIVDDNREHTKWEKETGPTAVGNYVGPSQLEDLITAQAEVKKTLRRFEDLLISTYPRGIKETIWAARAENTGGQTINEWGELVPSETTTPLMGGNR